MSTKRHASFQGLCLKLNAKMKARLILENGLEFEGRQFGYEQNVSGEVGK